MSRGIIYIMTTIVPGLIKIGKTGSSNFKNRMDTLKRDGYRNVAGLECCFAIELDNYDETEVLLKRIFDKSRLPNTELFILDADLVTQLLSSFNGTLIYPPNKTKEEIIESAIDKQDSKLIPNGIYTLQQKKRSTQKIIKATAEVVDGNWILKKGSIIELTEDGVVKQNVIVTRASMRFDSDGVLLEDKEIGESPSLAASVVMYQSLNGWIKWKDNNGNFIDIYRKNNNDPEDDI